MLSKENICSNQLNDIKSGAAVKLSKPILFTSLTALLVGGMGMVWAMTLGAPRQDPYVTEVLNHPGDLERGKILFNSNCAACHGIGGGGEVGPNLHQVSQRRNDTQLVVQVTSGKTPPMPRFELKPDQMADLLQYLKSL